MINFDEIEFFKGLDKFSEEVKYRYCIPGHDKNDEVINCLGEKLAKYDITETIGTDDLNYPENFIKKSLEELSEIYNTKRTFISVNGSSGALINAILSVTKPNEKILVQRDCHKSVYNACILGDIDVDYLYPNYDAEYDLNLGISCNALMEKIKISEDIKALIVTYPNYKGICSDIKSIANICHENDIILIVDEAHGSHFAFSEKLPLAAEHAGADIVVQSMHKTLPALTQTSLLHVCSDRVNQENIEKMFKLTITSSPSYIFMASIIAAVHYMNDVGRVKLDYIMKLVCEYRNKYNLVANATLDRDKIRKIGGYDFDSTRPILSLIDYDMDGTQLEEMLRYKYKIAMEYSDFRYCVGYFTVNDDEDKIAYLFESLYEIMKKNIANKIIHSKIKARDFKYPKCDRIMKMRDAFYADDQLVNLENSLNSLASNFIIPYPPGIPLICPGERITSEVIEYMIELLANNIKVYGLDKNNIRIIKQ